MPWLLAAALAQAMETASVALAPRTDLLSVPSSVIIALSTANRLLASMPRSALSMLVETFLHARRTPLPL